MNLLQELGIKHRFRDPIHGYIWLTEKEREIIDTPLFQRLRRISQLALTKYVYPTAEHSRFVHSLGVLQCATSIFLGIINHPTDKLEISGFDKLKHLELLRYAALLHDVGHLPFSHAAEKTLLPDLDHEDLSRFIIRNYLPIKDILGLENAKQVAAILSSDVKSDYDLAHEIISGNLDADRADYLCRDSYFCGVKYGEFDLSRYVQAFGVIGNVGELQLIVNEKDIYVVEALLLSRYHYNFQVPFHRTRGGYDIVLRLYFEDLKKRDIIPVDKPIESVINGEIATVDFSFLEDFDDYSIFEYCKKDARLGNDWARFLLRQDHLRPVYEISSSDPEVIEKASQIAQKLTGEYEDGQDFFVAREKVNLFKAHKSNDTASKRSDIFIRKANGDIAKIEECSEIIKALNKTVNITRIYSLPEKQKEIKNIIDEDVK